MESEKITSSENNSTNRSKYYYLIKEILLLLLKFKCRKIKGKVAKTTVKENIADPSREI